ncbi:MAG TPA: hypothetical protein VHS58_11175 [Acetobacteraceae bacterium]|jgi:hypothetical protein|nr:hypothetical protein [Acetobacteraceae bacterium]
MSEDDDGEEEARRRARGAWTAHSRAQTFTFGELMGAVGALAVLRIEHELLRIAAAHDTQEHHLLDEQRDCGVVQNIRMAPPTVLGHKGRLTAGCALAHLLETLWGAEADLLKQLEREAAQVDEGEG